VPLRAWACSAFQMRRAAAPALLAVTRGRVPAAGARRRLALRRPPLAGTWPGGVGVGASRSSSSTSAPRSSAQTAKEERDALVASIAARLKVDPVLCNRVGLAIDDRTATRLSTPWTDGKVPRPAVSQLSSLFLRNAIPFVGFGFFDNMIMLTTGEAIDETFGVAFGFSTLAAAGMGQMVSDACGITLQGLIERFADSLGLPDPRLSREQQTSDLVQWIVLVSRVVGIVIGCFFGMFPLLLMPNKEPRFVDYADQGSLSASSRRELMQHVETRTYGEGEILIENGALVEHMLLVQTGKVRVVGHDHTMLNKPFTVTMLEPGQVFGEPKIFAPSPVVLIAEEVARVQWVPKKELLRITGREAATEVWEHHRNQQVRVYVHSHGPVFTGQPRAVQGTGKTRFFAALPEQDKLDLLECTGKDSSSWGSIEEEQTLFFSGLSQEEKRSAIFTWIHDKDVHEHHRDVEQRSKGHGRDDSSTSLAP